jgi:two-component system CheB/CheR fusion protein
MPRPGRAKKSKANRTISRALPRADSESSSFPVVGIGASAGGLEAVRELLRYISAEKMGMAFVFVQHLDPTRESGLEEILSRFTSLPVTKVTDGVKVEPDRFYVIPANATMSVADGVLHLVPREKSRGLHLPIDHFFVSLAQERGDRAIGIILSGTATDGTHGCSAIKAGGGITFAQDPESAKYNSMPGSAIEAGCIDFIMSPRQIAGELVRISRHPYLAPVLTPEDSSDFGERKDWDTLFASLRQATGVDFLHYKQSTLQRRIKRRMALHRLLRLKDYLRFIRDHPEEIEYLYSDLLIRVTEFFREKEAFESLRKNALQNTVQSRRPEDGPIRVWVPGCSTGEEVYSLAIVMLEFLAEEANRHRGQIPSGKALQIFGTDISDAALARARRGVYSEAALSKISSERLKRFFARADGGYQINKAVREICVFANQNLAKDPPFSNLDLISCRNVLIYLGPILQKRVISTFYYALKPSGYLMLGGSESLGSFSDYFTVVDKKCKIYQKKRTASRMVTYFPQEDYATRRPETSLPPKTAPTGFTVEREVERILANRFVPASIVVNDDMEIVQFRGKTGSYLEPASGHPTFSLSKMAREGLLLDLREALTKAKKKNEPVRKERVPVKSNGVSRDVDIEVIPVSGQNSKERFYIVVFQDTPQFISTPAEAKHHAQKAPRHGKARDEHGRLSREVKHLREQLQALIEDHETTLEEFKSANEEVLSANEELQSTNEELETAKEELQSANEELTTLNEELQNRNTELTVANNDQLNLMANVNLPVVMVGNDLRIRRFTPPAEKLLNLLPGDIGRRLGEIRGNVETDDIEQIAHDTIESATIHEKEVRQKDGPWFLLRVRPYRTWDNKIDGAVLSFQDIDALKRALDRTRNFADALIETAREAIVVLDQDLRVVVANQAFYRLFQASPAETERRMIYELGSKQWDVPALRDLLDKITKTNSRVDDFEVEHNFPHLGIRRMILNARRIGQEGQYLILLAIEDVTRLARTSQV